MTEKELREQIAAMVFRKLMWLPIDDDSYLPDSPTSSGFAEDVADCVVALLKQAGYRLVEPVELEVLPLEKISDAIGKKTSERYLARHCTDAEAKAISQETLAHNLKFGQLYRVKEVKP